MFLEGKIRILRVSNFKNLILLYTVVEVVYCIRLGYIMYIIDIRDLYIYYDNFFNVFFLLILYNMFLIDGSKGRCYMDYLKG